MKNRFSQPEWHPRILSDQKILIIGATGGIGKSLLSFLSESRDCIIGAHGNKNTVSQRSDKIIPIQKALDGEGACEEIIDKFTREAGGLDATVILSGSINYSNHWMKIPEDAWNIEISQNLSYPFFLARSSMGHMMEIGSGGKIILTGTESSLHGGSEFSFPYSIAKRGTECMVQGLAREGAPHNILVNGVRMGYIKSGFHERWHNRSEADMDKRSSLVPLKRGGDPAEVAAMITYLLSGYGDFITGQMLPITGGDWL